jgi:hypothetical protein
MPRVTRESPSGPRSSGGSEPSIFDEIMDVGQGDKLDQFLIYGDTGTGKTRLGCTWPKPLLLVGAEDGRKSVKNVSGVKFIRLKSPDQISDIIRAAQSDPHPWKTVVLDTLTSFHGMVLAKVKGVEEMPAQREYGDASRDEYKAASFITKQHCRDLLRLAERRVCHVIILSQEKVMKPKEDGMDPSIVKPKIMGSAGEATVKFVNAECDYIVHTEVRNRFKVMKIPNDDGTETELHEPLDGRDFCLRLLPDQYYVCKFRAPDDVVVPDYITDPTYAKLKKLMDGEPKAATNGQGRPSGKRPQGG